MGFHHLWPCHCSHLFASVTHSGKTGIAEHCVLLGPRLQQSLKTPSISAWSYHPTNMLPSQIIINQFISSGLGTQIHLGHTHRENFLGLVITKMRLLLRISKQTAYRTMECFQVACSGIPTADDVFKITEFPGH